MMPNTKALSEPQAIAPRLQSWPLVWAELSLIRRRPLLTIEDRFQIKIPDPKVSIDRRWRVTILFPEKTGQEVPVGSKIFVSHEAAGNQVLPRP
jgi:hypothetical protein